VWLDSSGIEVLPTDIGNSPMKMVENGGLTSNDGIGSYLEDHREII
jgi:hypothetical protein